MPILLRLVIPLGAFFGIVGSTAGLAGLVGVLRVSGPLVIDGESIPESTFLALAVPLLVLYVAACFTAGAASWSLWKRRRRSRALLTVLLAEFVLGDAAVLLVALRLFRVPALEVAASAAVFTVLVVLGLWYLYRKRSVVGYFESLEPTAA